MLYKNFNQKHVELLSNLSANEQKKLLHTVKKFCNA